MGALILGTLAYSPLYIQGSCASTGEGLYEGLDWLAAACKKQNK